MAAQWAGLEEEDFEQPLPAPTSNSLPSRESSASPRKRQSRPCLETVCEEGVEDPGQQCPAPVDASSCYEEQEPQLLSPVAAASWCHSEEIIIQVDEEDKHVEFKTLQSPVAAGIHRWCQSLPSPAKSPASRRGLKSETQAFMAVCPQGTIQSPEEDSYDSKKSEQYTAHAVMVCEARSRTPALLVCLLVLLGMRSYHCAGYHSLAA